jgi:hypothetical protein
MCFAWFHRKMMMAEDLGVEAKEASVREFVKLLPLPKLLQSIALVAKQQQQSRPESQTRERGSGT